jgi:hypothetical protein
MGWIKAVGNWIFGQLGNFPTAAAQKEKYETKIMLLEAEHKKAIDVLKAENRDLRAKIEPLTQENKQLHASVSFLEQQLQAHKDSEQREPRIPGADVGGL